MPRFSPPPPPPGPVLHGDDQECDLKRKQLEAEFKHWINMHPRATSTEVSQRNATFQVHVFQSTVSCKEEYEARRRDQARHRHEQAVRAAAVGLRLSLDTGASEVLVQPNSQNPYSAGAVSVQTKTDGVVRPSAGEPVDDVQAWEAVIPRVLDKARSPSIASPSHGRIAITWAESSAFSEDEAWRISPSGGVPAMQSRIAVGVLDTHGATESEFGKFDVKLLEERTQLHQPGSQFQRYQPVLWSDPRAAVLRVLFGAEVDPFSNDMDAEPGAYAFTAAAGKAKAKPQQERRTKVLGANGEIDKINRKGMMEARKMSVMSEKDKQARAWKIAVKSRQGRPLTAGESGVGMDSPDLPGWVNLPPPLPEPVEEVTEPTPTKRELHVLMSLDAGESWTAPESQIAARRIEAPRASLSSSPVAVRTNGPDSLFISEGLKRSYGPGADWLLPITIHEDPGATEEAEARNVADKAVWPTLPGARPGSKFTPHAGLIRTSDDGMTYSPPEAITRPGEDLVSPSLVSTPDGRVVAFLADKRGGRGRIHRSESGDVGKTWATPTPTNLPSNGEPVGACLLASGKIAIVFSNALAPHSAPMSIALSHDGGITFDHIRDLESTWANTTAQVNQLGGYDDDAQRPYGPGSCVGTATGPAGSPSEGVSMVHVVFARSTPTASLSSLLYKTFPETWVEEGSGKSVGRLEGQPGYRRRPSKSVQQSGSVVWKDALLTTTLTSPEEGKEETVGTPVGEPGEPTPPPPDRVKELEQLMEAARTPPPPPPRLELKKPKETAYDKYAKHMGIALPPPTPGAGGTWYDFHGGKKGKKAKKEKKKSG